MKARSRKLGDELRAVCQDRMTEPLHLPDGTPRSFERRFVWITLTQKKRSTQNEDCAGAFARISKSWTRLTAPASKHRNEDLRGMIAGGVRGFEVVWSGRGKEVFEGRKAVLFRLNDARKKRGEPPVSVVPRAKYFDARRKLHQVRYSGWHAHIHAIVELRNFPSSDWYADFEEEVREVWAWASPGSSPEIGVDVQRLDLDSVFQVAKYVSKPLSLPPKRAKELFRAIHSRRMLNGFGSWLSWRKWAPESENPYAGAKLCAQSIQTIARRFAEYEERGRGSLAPEHLSFCEWHHCSERGKTYRRLVASMSPLEVRARLHASAAMSNRAASMRNQERAERMGGAPLEEDSPIKLMRLLRENPDIEPGSVKPAFDGRILPWPEVQAFIDD
jgi:hypothetical protein